MMVNMRTANATVYIAFSSSRKVALIERIMLQYTSLSMKYHHCTLSEIKTQIFTMSGVLACVSVHCVDEKKHSNPGFLTKTIDITLQTCVDVAKGYLQAYKTGADVKNQFFCSLH